MDDFVPVDQVSNELWNRVININLNGPFFAIYANTKMIRVKIKVIYLSHEDEMLFYE